jgi:HEAT repeat protein
MVADETNNRKNSLKKGLLKTTISFRSFMIILASLIVLTACNPSSGNDSPLIPSNTPPSDATMTPSFTPRKTEPILSPTETLVPTSEPTFTPEPTPTLVPVRDPTWQDLEVERLCLEVDQIYPQLQEAFNLPISTLIRQSLEGLRIDIVENLESCDAMLEIRFSGTALGEDYEFSPGSPVEYCYSGVEIEGQLKLSASGYTTITSPIQNRVLPPYSIDLSECASEPIHGPFMVGLAEPFVNGMFSIWGFPILIELIEDDSIPEITQAAYYSFANESQQNPIEAAPIVYQELLSPLPELQALAAYSLNGLSIAGRQAGVPSDWPELFREVIHQQDESVQYSALIILDSVSSRKDEVVPDLIQILESGDPWESAPQIEIARNGLASIGSEAVPALIEALGEESTYQMQIFATQVLSEIGPEAVDAVGALIPLLISDEWDVELFQNAQWALTSIGPSAVPALVEALQDTDAKIRAGAANTIGLIFPQPMEAIPALEDALNDDDPEVREAASNAIQTLNTPIIDEDVDVLIHNLEYGTHDQKLESIYQLTYFVAQAPEAFQALNQALASDDYDLRLEAASAIWRRVDPESSTPVPYLVELFDNPEFSNPDGYGRMDSLLLTLGDGGQSALQAMPMLIDLLEKEQDVSIQSQFLITLKAITGQTFSLDIEGWRHWWDTNNPNEP